MTFFCHLQNDKEFSRPLVIGISMMEFALILLLTGRVPGSCTEDSTVLRKVTVSLIYDTFFQKALDSYIKA